MFSFRRFDQNVKSSKWFEFCLRIDANELDDQGLRQISEDSALEEEPAVLVVAMWYLLLHHQLPPPRFLLSGVLRIPKKKKKKKHLRRLSFTRCGQVSETKE